MVEESCGSLPFLQKRLDEGLEVAPEVVGGLVAVLASGRANTLSGRLVSVREDLDAIIRQAEDVRARELYMLRVQTL
jgi:hypothetical protein